MIEPLESRIAPAALTATYTEPDGDQVKITVTVGTLLGAPALDGRLTYVGSGTSGSGFLSGVDLTDPAFQGASVTFAVTKKSALGDGLAHVGVINATGRDLGAVVVKGDLAAIKAGDNSTGDLVGFGVKSLTVQTFGVLGTQTGAALNGSNTVESVILGGLGALTVKGDFSGAYLHVTGNGAGDSVTGRIGAVTIGGALTGGATLASGSIQASGDIGLVKVARDITGGAGQESGRLQSDAGKIKGVTVGGSLLGGAGALSGLIRSSLDLGAVKITGNVAGDTGSASGAIASATGLGPDTGKIISITIGGSLLGGYGNESGLLRSAGDMGPVKIGRDVFGSVGDNAGKIDSGGAITSLAIGGSVFGGEGDQNVDPGAVGQIHADGRLGATTIGGDFNLGAGPNAGMIRAVSIASVSIVGSMSGEILTPTTGGGDIGPVKIGRDLQGLSLGGNYGGNITAKGSLASVTIGGSMRGLVLTDTVQLFGGGASIFAGGNIGPVKIAGDLEGGSVVGSGSLNGPASIRSQGRIASVFIGGSIISGSDASTGTLSGPRIDASTDLGPVTVRGGLLGNALAPILIFASGQVTPGAKGDIAIASITIGGSVEYARIRAGDSNFGDDNADASIGAVSVGGHWIASSLVAGAQNLGADNAPGGTGGNADNVHFGNGNDSLLPNDDAALTARIASIVIKGIVAGTGAVGDDHFGFVAQEIGSFKMGAFAPLLGGPVSKVTIPLAPLTTDVRIHEI